MTGEPKLYTVPADTSASVCRGESCRGEIYWISYRNPTTGKDVKLPVDCNVPEGRAPVLGSDGVGVSHFTTCPDVGHFSRKK